MRFRKFDIPTPNPWKYPPRYPYIILEGPARPLTEDDQRQIRANREVWRPSKIANNINELLKRNIGKTILLQVENPENYYDTSDELPKPFIAELKDITTERVLDFDIEFDQLFILLSNPRLLSGESIFKEYDYDYEDLLKTEDGKVYKLNFNTVTEFSIEKVAIWKQLLNRKNGS